MATPVNNAPGMPPGLGLMLEPVRALAEAASLPASLPALSLAPRGDDRVVMVLPGFATTDRSTSALRLFLTSIGYRSRAWEIGRNLGFRRTLGALLPRFLALTDQQKEPISLVGWSLGGTMARELARHYPDRIRDVVTMGSPIMGQRPALDGSREINIIDQPPEVPCTAIFSRTDAIVPAEISQDVRYPNCENIEVRASHMGLGVNPGVFFAVADRLAAPTEDRAPFNPPPMLRSWYP